MFFSANITFRAIVVDKRTYLIGGFYYPGSERRYGQALTPAHAYTEDPNYVKRVITCTECGWFGLMEENTKHCPFCGNSDLKITREMMRPWGFASRNAEAIPDVQLSEECTAVQQPLYSTIPDAEEMKLALGCKYPVAKLPAVRKVLPNPLFCLFLQFCEQHKRRHPIQQHILLPSVSAVSNSFPWRLSG